MNKLGDSLPFHLNLMANVLSRMSDGGYLKCDAFQYAFFWALAMKCFCSIPLFLIVHLLFVVCLVSSSFCGWYRCFFNVIGVVILFASCWETFLTLPFCFIFIKEVLSFYMRNGCGSTFYTTNFDITFLLMDGFNLQELQNDYGDIIPYFSSVPLSVNIKRGPLWLEILQLWNSRKSCGMLSLPYLKAKSWVCTDLTRDSSIF